MSIFLGIGVSCILLGIVIMLSTFWIQRKEDRERMAGFYTTATIAKIVPNEKAGQTRVTFEFTKDFKIQQVTNEFPFEQAKNWVKGRNSLIVYQEENNKIFYNPMKKSRDLQAILLAVGFLILLAGLSFCLMRP